MSDGRAEAKRAFLAEAGWGGAALSPLAGDASNRRYERADSGRLRAVLMDAPAERGEDLGRFLAITGELRRRGLSAPEVFHADEAAGFALIEDLGDALFARVAAAEPGLETAIYEAAVDLLPLLEGPPAFAEGAGARADIPPYDEAVLVREAMLALDWWAAGAGRAASDDAKAEFAALVSAACAAPALSRRALVLRDYHAENLLWLPERRGHARVGLLDYQDALAGHAAYDLISLTEDARRDVPAPLREGLLARRIAATGEDRDAFEAAAAALAAQRNLKIVGIFARLRLRDGKGAYLALIPRVWAHLMRDLAHPALAPLAAFVSAHVPPPEPAALARVGAGG